MRTRTLVQAIVNAEAAEGALKEYRDVQMPYLPKMHKDDRSKHIQHLMAEVSKGAMSITPVMQKRVKSKMKTKVVSRDEERIAASNRVSRKIGGMV